MGLRVRHMERIESVWGYRRREDSHGSKKNCFFADIGIVARDWMKLESLMPDLCGQWQWASSPSQITIKIYGLLHLSLEPGIDDLCRLGKTPR